MSNLYGVAYPAAQITDGVFNFNDMPRKDPNTSVVTVTQTNLSLLGTLQVAGLSSLDGGINAPSANLGAVNATSLAVSGTFAPTTIATSGTITSGGKLTASAGCEVVGALTADSTVNITGVLTANTAAVVLGATGVTSINSSGDAVLRGDVTIGTSGVHKTDTLYGQAVQYAGTIGTANTITAQQVEFLDTLGVTDEMRLTYSSFDGIGHAANNQLSWCRVTNGVQSEGVYFGSPGTAGAVGLVSGPSTPAITFTSTTGTVYPLTTFNNGLISTAHGTALGVTTTAGLFTANAGISVPSGQTTTVDILTAGDIGCSELTTSGLSTGLGGFADASGNLSGLSSTYFTAGGSLLNSSGLGITAGTVSGGWSRVGKCVSIEIDFDITYTYGAGSYLYIQQSLPSALKPGLSGVLGGAITISSNSGGTTPTTVWNAYYVAGSPLYFYIVNVSGGLIAGANPYASTAALGTSLPSNGDGHVSCRLSWSTA